MSRLWLILWLIVIATGVWMRLWQLGIQILIDDEWHAIHRLMLADAKRIFLSFGLADYSIPLTLLFNWAYETIGLTEWRLRSLPLLFGLVTIVLVPVLLRPWLDPRERWVLGLMLALSPVLIHYARHVRPYAIIVVLGLMAMIALWRWWHEERGAWAAVFFPAAVLSAWLQPLTALFTGAALTWFGIIALARWWRHGEGRKFFTLMLLGGVTVAACCLLLLPPLLTTPGAISEKAGVHHIRPDTVLRAWELLIGSVRPAMALIMLGLFAVGVWQLWLRDRMFLLYWCWLMATTVTGVMFLGPAWIHNALVLVRYTAIVQPIVLALAAIGLVYLLSRFAEQLPGLWRQASITLGGIVLAVALYFSGPLPELYRGVNQFTNAARYQADYNLDRSIFAFMNEVPVPDFYNEISAAPGDWEVIEAPWHFESNNTPLMEYQKVHQRRVRIGMISGLCTPWTWGELRPEDRLRIGFSQFVFLTDILDNPTERNRFVVFDRVHRFDHARRLPDIEPCIDTFRERFGQPWRESDTAVVFRLTAD